MHPFHKTIGDMFDRIFAQEPGYQVLKDTACGGNHTLPLFRTREKSSRNRYCLVDLMALKSLPSPGL